MLYAGGGHSNIMCRVCVYQGSVDFVEKMGCGCKLSKIGGHLVKFELRSHKKRAKLWKKGSLSVDCNKGTKCDNCIKKGGLLTGRWCQLTNGSAHVRGYVKRRSYRITTLPVTSSSSSHRVDLGLGLGTVKSAASTLKVVHSPTRSYHEAAKEHSE